jgi:hypothetical protein
MCVGDSQKLTVSGTTKKVTWKSSKPKIARVTSSGTVKALRAGNAVITATVSKKTYRCKVLVNETFKVERTSVSIKKNTIVNIFLSVNGSVNVNASVADKKICSATFGKWDGDYMPVTITPKSVGSTTVTFTNTANQEVCTLKVKVTAVPVKATFQTPTISDGATSFIAGENTMSFRFQLDRAASAVSLKLYDADGDEMRSFDLGAVKAKKTKTVTWDGMDADGNPYGGSFKYAVVADGTKTTGGKSRVLEVSPFENGDGTKNNPYRVSSLKELYLMKNYNGAYFVQDADIDFNYSSLEPLFDDSAPFSGTYDGKYENKSYQMLNLYGYNSVFGSIGETGAVKNISMSNCVLNTTGSLLAFTNSGTIDGCSVNGNILCNAGNQAAMLVMYNKGTIRGCNVSGTLTVSASNVIGATALKAGGLVLNNTGMIAQCTSSVTLKEQMNISTYVPGLSYELYTGGIVAENANGAFVVQCTFTGSIMPTVTLPETVTDVTGLEAGKIYSGYVAGSSYGYIDRCINASASGSGLGAQGIGTGTIQ